MDRLSRLVDRISFLEPEDESTLSSFEIRARAGATTLFKSILALIFAWHLFDFLFSAVWMHGYIWSLNLPIDLDLSDKSAGSIVYHQRDVVSQNERILHAAGAVLATIILLVCSGFASGSRSVWELVKLAMTIGLVAGTVRPLQMRQRLFSSLHEGFYIEFMVFFIGVFLTIGRKEAKPTAEENTIEKETSSEENKKTEDKEEIKQETKKDK